MPRNYGYINTQALRPQASTGVPFQLGSADGAEVTDFAEVRFGKYLDRPFESKGSLAIELNDVGSTGYAIARIICDSIKRKPNLTIGMSTGLTMSDLVYPWILRITREEGIDWSAVKIYMISERVGYGSMDHTILRNYLNRELLHPYMPLNLLQSTIFSVILILIR